MGPTTKQFCDFFVTDSEQLRPYRGGGSGLSSVSNVAILPFFVAFLAYFGTLCYFLGFFFCKILVSLAFHTVLLQIRFVVIYALFQLFYFGSIHVCVKIFFFACLVVIPFYFT